MAKYLFVTGGVLSSLGKGITVSSIGAVFKAQGYSVLIKKFDPYLNYNPGMMSPLQHGEVFVTEDGGEGDLDLGHYERFVDTNTHQNCDITSGLIYYSVISKERKGVFNGRTIQVIPDITDEIKRFMMEDDAQYEIICIEIGGTVGDIEGQPFFEAIRQMRFDLGDDNVAYVHVTPLIYLKAAGELKTKPTQHSVQKLREIGIIPDMLVCRTEFPISLELKKKLGLFCNVKPEAVVSAMDASPLYQVILNLYREGANKILLDKFKLENRPADLSAWENLIFKLKNPKYTVRVGVVGKYIDMKDAYISLDEALIHAGAANDSEVVVEWIAAEDLEIENYSEKLKGLDGILIPGGFGKRGVDGKINAASYARTKDIPFFGSGSLGMQCAIIEVLRNVTQISDANSVEADPDTKNPVFQYIDTKGEPSIKRGRMRLGGQETKLQDGSLAQRIYGTNTITERHRHRLEFNNNYKEVLNNAGLTITGVDEEHDYVDIVELKSHNWFFACQFIPEYKSRPLRPHPLFISFISAMLRQNNYKTLDR